MHVRHANDNHAVQYFSETTCCASLHGKCITPPVKRGVTMFYRNSDMLNTLFIANICTTVGQYQTSRQAAMKTATVARFQPRLTIAITQRLRNTNCAHHLPTAGSTTKPLEPTVLLKRKRGNKYYELHTPSRRCCS